MRQEQVHIESSPAERILEGLYLAYLALVVLLAFAYTTMIPLHFSDSFHHLVLVSGAVLVFFKLALGRPWSRLELLSAVVLGGSLALARVNAAQLFILELAVLMVGARGLCFEKIVKVYLAVSLPALLLTMALALTGQIENLIYSRAGRLRIAFGVAYPTDFASHVFFLTCCYFWLRERRMRLFEPLIAVALALFCYHFCDARTSVVCLLLLAAGLFYIQLRRRLGRKQKKPYRMSRAGQGLLCAAPAGLAGLMCLLSWLYTPSSHLMVMLDLFLSTRLELGHRGLTEYGLSWFGKFVYMTGLGNSLEHEGGYFWLDSSYINILLRFGVVVFLLVLAILTVGALRQKKNRSWERLGILAVVALQCLMEHHLIEIGHNPYLLMALAFSSVDPADARLFPPRKKQHS